MRTSLVQLVLIGLLASPAIPQTQPPTVPVKALMEHATHQEKALYPAIAKAAHITGDVVVGVELDETGKVTKYVLISGPEMLRSNAIDAAKQWTFSPVEVDGKASTVRSAIIFKFHDLYASTSE